MMLKHLTTSVVSRLQDGNLDLRGVADAVGIKSGSHVLLVGNRSGTIRIIPLESGSAIELRVEFSLTAFPESARKVLAKVKQFGLSILHSTGFCPVEDCCIWEAFFEGPHESRVDELVAWLNEQDAVMNVEHNRLGM